MGFFLPILHVYERLPTFSETPCIFEKSTVTLIRQDLFET